MTEPRYPKIAVGLPNMGSIRIETAHSLLNMYTYMTQKYTSKGVLDVCTITVGGTLLPASRNKIVETAMEMDATHLLWVDGDMKFPCDAMEILLSRRLPIVGANYSQRRRPCKPTAASLDGNWLYEEGQTGTEQVKFLGHGLCLVEMAVYEAMDKPWYMLEWNEDRQEVMGEDVFFFREAAAQIECPAYVDHDISVNTFHIGDHQYSHADALADNAEVVRRQQAGEDENTDTEALKGA
jgi:hypothetical protein